jgi:Mg-chelatase subunit ChlD
MSEGSFTLTENRELKQLAGGRSSIIALRQRQTSGGGALLLVDGSSSMSDKLDQAKNGAKEFAKKVLVGGSSVGVVLFRSVAELLVETTIDFGKICDAVNQIEASGSTDMAAGIKLADLILGNHNPRTIVIVTDGRPNNREEALFAADEARLRDIDIICIGVDGADMEFLNLVATVSDMAMHVHSANLQKTIEASADLLRLPGK